MYSPKLKDHQIKKIYLLAKDTGVPMTKIVKIAIDQYLEKVEPLLDDIFPVS